MAALAGRCSTPVPDPRVYSSSNLAEPEFFAMFDFTLSYWPGSKNAKADVLSRVHDTVHWREKVTPINPLSRFLLCGMWTMTSIEP